MRASAVSGLKLLTAILTLSALAPAAPPESLQFAIEWRLIPAGTAKLSWLPTQRPNSSEIRLHLESAGLVSRLFRVDDDYRALLGPNLCAESSSLIAKEGNRSKETRVTFDAKAAKAFWTEKDLVKAATTNKEVEIPPCVHDVMGGLLALRSLRLEPGKTVRIPISDGKKSVQARIEAQDREDIHTPAGTFRAVRYEVYLFNNVLFSKPGHLHIWLTDDERRLPVQLQVRLQFTIGTITFRLLKEEN